MLTKDEALISEVFHQEGVTRLNGECYRFIRNGETKITRDDLGREGFLVPIAYPGSTVTTEEIWEGSAIRFHSEQKCPYLET